MKIAIIGSGIAGLTSAYLLGRRHEITLFEAGNRIGGHTHTVNVTVDDKSYAIDTGFIVFNDWTYPNFIRLLGQIGVKFKPTEMSFRCATKTPGSSTTATTSTACLPSAATSCRPGSGACCATSCVSIARHRWTCKSNASAPT